MSWLRKMVLAGGLLASAAAATPASAGSCTSEHFTVEVRTYETATEFVQRVQVGCRSATDSRYEVRHPIVDGVVEYDATRGMIFRTLAAAALGMQALPAGDRVEWGVSSNGLSWIESDRRQ